VTGLGAGIEKGGEALARLGAIVETGHRVGRRKHRRGDEAGGCPAAPLGGRPIERIRRKRVRFAASARGGRVHAVLCGLFKDLVEAGGGRGFEHQPGVGQDIEDGAERRIMIRKAVAKPGIGRRGAQRGDGAMTSSGGRPSDLSAG